MLWRLERLTTYVRSETKGRGQERCREERKGKPRGDRRYALR